jgi:serine/threonine protein kinase
LDSNHQFRTVRGGLPAGTRLNGIYEIDHIVGLGGMGEVYKGHEIQTGSAVAIKMLLPEMADNVTVEY